MSEMHYIAKFAEKQLADAIAKGMNTEQQVALLNALKGEAEALTPGGGYIVAYVAKGMDSVEELPGKRAEQHASTTLRNAYLFTCIVGYSHYHHKVVFADTLSSTLIENTVSDLKLSHAMPNCGFQFAGVTPLGMMNLDDLNEQPGER